LSDARRPLCRAVRRRSQIGGAAASRLNLGAWLADQPNIARRCWAASAINGFCAVLVIGPERIPGLAA
jgi:hypothetical protein